MGAVLSLDLGGTKLAASVVDRRGRRLAGRRAACPAAGGPAAVVARLVDLARGARDVAGVPVEIVGVAAGGPIDRETGVVDRPPNLPGWTRVPLRAMLSEGLGLPEALIHLENDANAGALAEQRFGAARGRSHAIFLTMGTGIGAGLILGGRLHRGARGLAGEAGHQIVVPDGPECGCGGRGCLEAVASGAAIARRLREGFDELPESIREAAGSPGAVAARHVIDAARAGDPFAVSFVAGIAALLARGLANLVFVLDPEVIVLGTLGYRAGDRLMVPLRDELRRLCWPALTRDLDVVASPLGRRLEALSGLAAALAAEEVCPPPC